MCCADSLAGVQAVQLMHNRHYTPEECTSLVNQLQVGSKTSLVSLTGPVGFD